MPRPYPTEYITHWTAKDGTPYVLRPIRPSDEPMMVVFHGYLSTQSVYMRYAGFFKMEDRTEHRRLMRICHDDYDRELTLVAERAKADGSGREILGVGRLTHIESTRDAEFALLIRDDAQGQGLGTELLRRLIDIARTERMERLVADMLWENRTMQAVSRKLGFNLTRDDFDDPMMHAVLEL